MYFDEELLRICLGLMRGEGDGGPGGEGEPLVMELFNMLVRPDTDFELRWHRDSIPFDGVDVQEEAERLGLRGGETRRAFHVQYNIPLYPDNSLLLVPGSHLRPRTPEELEALKDPYVKDLPGMMKVDGRPGDVIFYDNNVIHTGRYDSRKERLTLHGCVGDVRGGTGRARNILQHGLGTWAHDVSFGGLEPATKQRAEGMKRSLLKLGSEAGEDAQRGIYDE